MTNKIINRSRLEEANHRSAQQRKEVAVSPYNKTLIDEAIKLYLKLAARRGWTAPAPRADLSIVEMSHSRKYVQNIILCNARGQLAAYRMKRDGKLVFVLSHEADTRKHVEELMREFRPDDAA